MSEETTPAASEYYHITGGGPDRFKAEQAARELAFERQDRQGEKVLKLAAELGLSGELLGELAIAVKGTGSFTARFGPGGRYVVSPTGEYGYHILERGDDGKMHPYQEEPEEIHEEQAA